uniref:Reverse transcriptase domain-containing protein n=1 Tax=Tanacetum cinerariifolium TaxID=118510 RepID=A0A6L2NES0_TANCI|nr:reverse transcriptase domain-containing protein [Tanacetum cinerariifolium]
MEATPTLRLRSLVVHRQREIIVGFEEAPNKEGSKGGRNTKGSRPSKIKKRENGNKGVNLPPLLAAYLGRNESGQPLQSSLTSVHGGHQPSTNIGGISLLTGYHQIPIAKRDEEKTAFYTREGVFCYKITIWFEKHGRNLSRLIDKVFNHQLGRNMEVNAGDIVIKINVEEEMLVDIKETLDKLRAINLKLNPKKCYFGVEERIFSRHLITKQGIKANSLKVKAISDLQPPKSVSEMQNLNRKLAALNRLILVSKEGKEYTYALRFGFKTTNIEEEYEALLAGLCITKEIKVQELTIFVDSQLVANQVKRLFEARQTIIKQYLEKAKELLPDFPCHSIVHIKRDQNKKVDALSKLALMTFSKLSKEVLVEVIQDKPITQREVTNVIQENEDSWMTPIREYLQLDKLPDDPQKPENYE